jgi:cytochrome c oxidase assembly factor CtaG
MRRRLPFAIPPLALWLASPPAASAHGETPAAPTWPDVLFAWSFDPLPLIGIGLAAVVYLRAVRVVNARHPRTPVPRRHAVAWMLGLLAILLALQSPIDRYETALLSAHMVQHMLLQFVAAPLLLLGAPMTLALRAASPSARARLLRLLHSRAVRLVTNPLVAGVTILVVNYAWQFTGAYNVALENELVHYVQHATLLAVAVLFWWPIAGIDPAPNKLPYPGRLAYLVLSIPPNSALGIILLQIDPTIYPHYATNLRDWGPTLAEDFAMAGAIMWEGAAMMIVPAVLLTLAAWLRDDERRTRRLETRTGVHDRAAADRAAWLADKAGRDPASSASSVTRHGPVG